MGEAVVYGPNFSTYVRTTMLALIEKGAPHRLVEVAMLQGAHQEADFLARNPFGKVPAFEHDGLLLYETSAITRYIDRALPGSPLQPTDAKALARMDQVIGIVDSYAYPAMIGKLVWQRSVTPMMGGTPDEAVIEESLPRVRLCLAELARLLGRDEHFGGRLSLADLHLAPVFGYLMGTPEGQAAVADHRTLGSWWERISARPSMAATAPRFG